ncbi:hypothetical protein QQ045_003591 [Rhodiola kirilowii]
MASADAEKLDFEAEEDDLMDDNVAGDVDAFPAQTLDFEAEEDDLMDDDAAGDG